MYVTLKFDDNGCWRIHSISDGNEEIVTNEKYVVMPWKMVTRNRKNMTLTEAVDSILDPKIKSVKENREREEIEKKRKEHYEAHIKEKWRD